MPRMDVPEEKEHDGEQEVVRSIPFLEKTLQENGILESFGRAGREVGERLQSWALEVSDALLDRSDPKTVYRCFPVECHESGIEVGGRELFHSRSLVRAMDGCHLVLVFVATLGPAVDQYLKQMATVSLSKAYLADATASLLIEQAADAFEADWASGLEPGQAATLRYSPGYCDWPLEDQKALFRLVRGSRIGVELTEHALMVPRKSLSGVVGVGRPDVMADRGNACRSCDEKNCPHRRSR